MNILVIGKSGQLANELADLATSDIQLSCYGKNEIDLLDERSISAILSKESFDAVVNTSAYTAVDMAENHSEDAFALNATAVENLAKQCKLHGLYLLHVSTDFVFSGNQSAPYKVDDPIAPLSVYGESKAKGEELLLNIYPSSSCVIRTSWLYSAYGNNFVKTMLKLMTSKDELNVVGDQVGTPTYAKGLAKAIITCLANRTIGTYHYTDAGVATWYDFAVAIQELALEKSILDRKIKIGSIQTKDYPTPAKRPSYSVLDKSSLMNACPELELVHWRESLSEMLNNMNAS